MSRPPQEAAKTPRAARDNGASASAIPLLLSKLMPPQPGRFSVLRQAISERVFQSLEAKVILIRAPAGFGKTTAMAQLLHRYEQDGIRTAWVHLDEADNDMPRLVTYLSRAIDNALPESSPALPSSHNPGARLLERVGSQRTPFALFLDEFEALRNPLALSFVNQLIERLPQGAQILIGSRTVPEIGLGRLRARGHLLEVEPSQLRFSADEATDFLTHRRGLSLQPEQVSRLHRSTEGWVAALWLASVALTGRSNTEEFIASFAGSNSAIADYLSEDVFSGQSELVQTFLLKTSLFEQLDAARCNAVCEREDSDELLQQIERANLFLVPLDEARESYRYHSLFRDFLRALLKRRHPEWLGPLHRKAADWFLAEGRPVPAIHHALLSGNAAFSLPLLEQHADFLLGQGRMRMLARWLDGLTPAERESSFQLRLIHAWAVNFTRGSAEALTLIEGIDEAGSSDPNLLAQHGAMRPLFLGMRDRIAESYDAALAMLPKTAAEFGFARGMIAQTLANSSMILGRYADARRYADEARSAQTGQEARLNMALAETVDAAIDLMQGKLRQSLVRLRQAAEVSGDDLQQSSNRNAFPGVLLAAALFETGDVERAALGLEMFLPLALHLGLADQLIIAYGLYAQILDSRGEAERALQVIAELETAGYRRALPRVVASARLVRARTLIAQGDLRAARDQLGQCGDVAFWQEMATRHFIANDLLTYDIGQFRLAIRSGAAASVITDLKTAVDAAESEGRHRRALKLRILLAEALHRDGNSKSAMRMLVRALKTAAAEGFTNTFLEEGPVIQEMLHTLLQARQQESSFRSDESLDLHLSRLLQSTRPPPSTQPEPATVLAEPLTRKELLVLELLRMGYSNDLMAEKLFVSESTVRTHLRKINVKLQAGNRMQAIAIARRLRLIA